MKKIGWFNRARYGMFIHWGAYSVAGRGEWIMNRELIPAEEYRRLYAERFTARPYVKIGDVTYYGACYTTSLAEKAQALIDSGDTNEEYRTIVEQAGKEA